MKRLFLFSSLVALVFFVFLLGFISMSAGLGGWGDPPDGWDTLYTFDNLKGMKPSSLDNNGWLHDNGSDSWDGSAPGEAGTVPGGVHIEVLPGEGDPSGDAVVLSIEDTGDPRNAGASDPSNRKIYLENEVDFQGNFYQEGITFIARWRINPDPIEAPANGNDLHDGGKGQVGIVHDAAPGNLSFALDTGGVLYFGNESNPPLEVGDEFRFHTVWTTAVLDGNEYSVEIYLDGDMQSVFSENMVLGDGSDSDIYPNYVAVGLGSTGRDGAIQVDYIGYKIGIYTPEPFAVSLDDKLPVTWGKLKLR